MILPFTVRRLHGDDQMQQVYMNVFENSNMPHESINSRFQPIADIPFAILPLWTG